MGGKHDSVVRLRFWHLLAGGLGEGAHPSDSASPSVTCCPLSGQCLLVTDFIIIVSLGPGPRMTAGARNARSGWESGQHQPSSGTLRPRPPLCRLNGHELLGKPICQSERPFPV